MGCQNVWRMCCRIATRGLWWGLASCGSPIHRAMGLAGFLWEPDSSGDGFGCDPYRAINCAPTKPVPTAAIVGARFVGRWVLLRSLSRNKLRSHKTSSHGCNCGSPIHRAMGLAATLSRNKLRSHKISSTKSAPQNQFPPNQFPQNQFPPNQLPHHSSLRRPDPHTEITQPLRVPIWVVADFVA